MILTPETRDALNGQWSDDLVGTGRKNTLIEPQGI
jgi:hypothetical protein